MIGANGIVPAPTIADRVAGKARPDCGALQHILVLASGLACTTRWLAALDARDSKRSQDCNERGPYPVLGGWPAATLRSRLERGPF